jgi:hypothetical protein
VHFSKQLKTSMYLKISAKIHNNITLNWKYMLELLVTNVPGKFIFIFSLHYKHMSYGRLTYVTKKCPASSKILQIYHIDNLYSFLIDVGQVPRTHTITPNEIRSSVKYSSKHKSIKKWVYRLDEACVCA